MTALFFPHIRTTTAAAAWRMPSWPCWPAPTAWKAACWATASVPATSTWSRWASTGSPKASTRSLTCPTCPRFARRLSTATRSRFPSVTRTPATSCSLRSPARIRTPSRRVSRLVRWPPSVLAPISTASCGLCRTCRSTRRTSAVRTKPSFASTRSPARAAWPTCSRPTTTLICRSVCRSSSRRSCRTTPTRPRRKSRTRTSGVCSRTSTCRSRNPAPPRLVSWSATARTRP